MNQSWIPGRLAIIVCAFSMLTAVFTGRAAAQAEVIAAQNMQAMANALTVCQLDTTYYVTLENLNDTSGANATRPYDSIADLGGPYVIIPDNGYFLPRKNLATAFLSWQGPYVTYQTNNTQIATTPYDQGSLLDPWGSPYYLFNPLGLLRGDQGIITLELYGDQFDRYTIVSLGPDGVKSADDVIYPFGGGIDGIYLTSLSGDATTRTSIMSAAPEYDVQAGTTTTLRGINFGGEAPNKTAFFGTTVLNVLSWSNRAIVVEIPSSLTGTENFVVQIGSQSTNTIRGTIVAGETSVKDWFWY